MHLKYFQQQTNSRLYFITGCQNNLRFKHYNVLQYSDFVQIQYHYQILHFLIIFLAEKPVEKST